jgi:hypothetical protein
MGMMALVALAFTSCKKNQETKQTFFATGAQLSYEYAEDRAYVDEQSMFHFEQGDVCMLFNIDETTPTKSHAALYGATEGGTRVPFVNIGYGEIGEDMLDDYYAFYPGGVGHMITYLSEGQNKCKFYVAPEQEYRTDMLPKDAMYAAAKGENDSHLMHGETDFVFQPICGVLRLLPHEDNPGTRKVTKIEVVDNVFMLSGLVELIIPEVNANEILSLFNNYDPSNSSYMTQLEAWKTRTGYHVTDETIEDMLTGETHHYVMGHKMTLNIPGGVQLGTSKNSTPAFNIVLRPLAMSQGSHIIFTFDNGDVKDCDLSHVSRLIKPNVVLTQGLDLDNF